MIGAPPTTLPAATVIDSSNIARISRRNTVSRRTFDHQIDHYSHVKKKGDRTIKPLKVEFEDKVQSTSDDGGGRI